MSAKPLKILVIRLSSLGDVLVTTPVIRVLHTQLGAEVQVLTGPGPAHLLQHNPFIEKLHVYRKGIASVLRRERFDLAVDLHCNFRSVGMRLKLGLPGPGYSKRNFDKWLLAKGIDRLGDEHLVHRYFQSLRPLGVGIDGFGLDYFVQDEEREAVRALPVLSALERYRVLVMGGTHHTKRMPLELLENVLMDSPADQPWVLLGGEDVRLLSEKLMLRFASERRLINLCGQLSLRESAAVLEQASSVLSGDTGLMHLAAALCKPMVVVWGNTAPGYGMYPWMPRGYSRIVADAKVEGLSCQPCTRAGHERCPLGHFRCMMDQQSHKILAQLDAVETTMRHVEKS